MLSLFAEVGNATLFRYRNCYFRINNFKHYKNAYDAITQIQFQAINSFDAVDNSFLFNSCELFGNWYLPSHFAYILVVHCS